MEGQLSIFDFPEYLPDQRKADEGTKDISERELILVDLVDHISGRRNRNEKVMCYVPRGEG